MITILTGPVRSLKTTSLYNWAQHRADAGGILSPDVNGLRHLYHVKTGALIQWQRKIPLQGDILVGRFAFDPEGFTTGKQWLNDDLQNPAITTLILDEIGKLELKNLGWHSWLVEMLPFPEKKNLILVVRDSLLEEVIKHYQLDCNVVFASFFSQQT